MQKGLLGATRAKILETLCDPRNKRGLSLLELSQAVKLRPPTIFAHLKQMVVGGVIERLEIPRPRGPVYRAKPFFAATWVDPAHGIVSAWTTNGSMSWNYPLVSRVPDIPAQSVLVKILEQAENKGLFLPQMPVLQSGAGAVSARSHRRLRPAGTVRTRSGEDLDDGVTFVVFGSCARGDSRPDSDLDVLVIQPSRFSIREALRDLVAEVNLWAERKIDLRVVGRKEFYDSREPLFQAVKKEGITVFTSVDDGEYVESPGARGGAAGGQRS